MNDITEQSSATCPRCKRLKLEAHTLRGRRLDFFCVSCGASFDAEYVRDFQRGEIRIIGRMKNPKYVEQFGSEAWEGREVTLDPSIPEYLGTYVLEVIPLKKHPG